MNEFPITLTEEQVAAGVYREYCPVRHSFDWSNDFKTVTINKMTYWDDASYAAYQIGSYDGD
jgi:hypothetical protein